jgi:hypothetical protein
MEARMIELDALINLIDRYELQFGVTSLSLGVVTLSRQDEAELCGLLRCALEREHPIPGPILHRYAAPANAVS